jgi:prolyl-tRNA synthetase
MANFSEMIVGPLSYLWHLIPIIIFIILVKKIIAMKDNKKRKEKSEENEKNGLTLELRTIKRYEDLGYKVISNKINNQDINMFCYKDDKTVLVKCKNSSDSKSIREKDIMAFYDSAIKYIKTNEIKEKNTAFRYVVPYKDLFHKSAINILKDDSYNCKYVLI